MDHAAHADVLLDGFCRKEVSAGFLLATPGDTRDQVFVVESGRLRVYLAGENRSLTLSFLEPGDIYTTHTPTYIEAVAPTVLRVMETSGFARKLCEDPRVVGVVMRVLGRLLENSVTLVEDLAFREVPARLARFLLGLVERRGVAVDGGMCIPLELTTEDIASLLGTTRQTVSTLLNQWERDGLLRRQGRRSLIVIDIQGLCVLRDGDLNVGVG
jgi:CRP-like cAMP-binding protein